MLRLNPIRGPDDPPLFVSAVEMGYSPGSGTSAVGVGCAVTSRAATAWSGGGSQNIFMALDFGFFSFQDPPLAHTPS